MKTPSYNIRERYDFFNRTFFESKLPNDIKLTWTTKVTKKGTNHACVQWNAYTHTAVPGTFKIILNTLYQYSSNERDGILLHEMIHIYFYSINDFYESHGRQFVRMVEELTQRSGILIPMNDVTRNREVNENIQKREMYAIAMHLLDGKISVGFVTPTVWARMGGYFYRKMFECVTGGEYKKVDIRFGRTNLHRKYVPKPNCLTTYFMAAVDQPFLEAIPVHQTI